MEEEILVLARKLVLAIEAQEAAGRLVANLRQQLEKALGLDCVVPAMSLVETRFLHAIECLDLEAGGADRGPEDE